MKKLILLSVILFVGCSQLLSAGGFYISPGIQIGVNSSKEYYFSYQATFGATFGFEEDYGLPGITLGRRHYKTKMKKWETYNYIDAQISIPEIIAETIVVGTGVGIIYGNSNIFYKYKLFAGYFGLGTFDYINFNNKSKMHFGGFVVLPITNDCFWCF